MNGTLPYTIGMKLADNGGICCDILTEGSTLPAYVRKECTANAGQTCLPIEVTKTEAGKTSVLGTFQMPLPADLPAGEEIQLIFTAGLNGLLICSCKCKGNMVEKTIDL